MDERSNNSEHETAGGDAHAQNIDSDEAQKSGSRDLTLCCPEAQICACCVRPSHASVNSNLMATVYVLYALLGAILLKTRTDAQMSCALGALVGGCDSVVGLMAAVRTVSSC